MTEDQREIRRKKRVLEWKTGLVPPTREPVAPFTSKPLRWPENL